MSKLDFINSVINSENKITREEVINASNPTTIGANYYLAYCLGEYLHATDPTNGKLNYELEHKKLERDFIQAINPFLVKQTMSHNKAINTFNASPNIYGYENYLRNDLPVVLFDQSLKSIVDRMAAISFKKIVDKKPITEKDYGYIINKIALFMGDFTDFSSYNMLYVQLLHEIINEKDYGSYAEHYLNNILRKGCTIDSQLIEPECLPNEVTERKTINKKQR